MNDRYRIVRFFGTTNRNKVINNTHFRFTGLSNKRGHPQVTRIAQINSYIIVRVQHLFVLYNIYEEPCLKIRFKYTLVLHDSFVYHNGDVCFKIY